MSTIWQKGKIKIVGGNHNLFKWKLKRQWTKT